MPPRGCRAGDPVSVVILSSRFSRVLRWMRSALAARTRLNPLSPQASTASRSAGQDPLPKRVIHLGDARVVFTPMGKRLRVAGTMEFDRDPEAFHPRRVAAIVEGAHDYLRGVDWAARQEEWVGARVMTPDGLPAIGRLPGHERVLLASGHNMLGLMLAPATGRLVTDLLQGAEDPVLAGALDLARLARRA